MGSIDAKNVAKEVLETIGKDKKVDLGKIIRKNGYSANTSLTPKLVTETKSFKEAIEPVVDKMRKERDRLIQALSEKNLNKEKYGVMIDGLDKLTKNIQLLSGKETENVKTILVMPAELINKNDTNSSSK